CVDGAAVPVVTVGRRAEDRAVVVEVAAVVVGALRARRGRHGQRERRGQAEDGYAGCRQLAGPAGLAVHGVSKAIRRASARSVDLGPSLTGLTWGATESRAERVTSTLVRT